MRTAPRKVAVIGAGVGGLTVAARLAHAGHAVTVFEKNDVPGGRCGVLRDQGYTWDLGPTILLMRDVLEGIFRDLGRDPADYIDLMQCMPNYTIHSTDGSAITFSANLGEMRSQLEAIEPGSFQKYLAFLEFGRHAYDTSVAHLVSRPLDGVQAYLNPRLLARVLSVKAHRKLYGWISRYFRDERLRRGLSFQTMYLGLSPYQAPATFALLPYTELAMGIWYARGGLHALPRAIERLAREFGTTFRYGTSVSRIVVDGKLARGVEFEDGSSESFDLVIANADLPFVYQKLLPGHPSPVPAKPRLTSSAFMLYWGVDRTYPQLQHHNVVFGSKFEETFRDIFDTPRVPEDPSFYINRPSRTDSSLAPPGCDALYVLVPVAHQTEAIDWKTAAPLLRERIIRQLETRLGMTDLRQRIVVEHQFTPDQWASSFNLTGGACFGLSHDFRQVGALRPSTRDKNLKNLYFVGASTQPGTGVPLVMLSARIVAERLEREWSDIPTGAASAPPQRGGSVSNGPRSNPSVTEVA